MIAVPMGFDNFDQVHVGNPAAGAEFDYTVYPGYSQLIIAVEYTLVTCAAAGIRAPGLILDIQGVPGHGYHLTYHGNVNPTTTRILNWHVGIDRNVSGIVNNRDQIALPFPIYMRPNDHIRSVVFNLQGADQISDIFIYIHRFHVT